MFQSHINLSFWLKTQLSELYNLSKFKENPLRSFQARRKSLRNNFSFFTALIISFKSFLYHILKMIKVNKMVSQFVSIDIRLDFTCSILRELTEAATRAVPLLKTRLWHRYFPENTFFTQHLWNAASGLIRKLFNIFKSQKLAKLGYLKKSIKSEMEWKKTGAWMN